jgi:type I restriction enzyme M protein
LIKKYFGDVPYEAKVIGRWSEETVAELKKDVDFMGAKGKHGDAYGYFNDSLLHFEIDESMQKNISVIDLVDMMTFDRVDFEKTINLSVKKKIKYEEIWKTNKLVLLGDISDIKKGASITSAEIKTGKIPVVAGGQKPAYFHSKSNRGGNIITVSASGAYSGFINYFLEPIFASDSNTIKSKNESDINTKLIFEFLKNIQSKIYYLQRGQAQPHVYGDDLEWLVL